MSGTASPAVASAAAAAARALSEAGLGLGLVPRGDVRRNSFSRSRVKQWDREPRELGNPSYPRPDQIQH